MPQKTWSRDELILALELFFQEPRARGSATHPRVIELSEILNLLPLHPRDEREKHFRNPNGVGMKLSNFLRFDPDYIRSWTLARKSPRRGGLAQLCR